MLHRLEIENFYSIRDRQVIDLEINAKAPEDPIRYSRPPSEGGRRYPKVVAFFGANGSGKTTALRSLSFLERFARKSFSDYQPGERIDVMPFAHSDWQKRPTRFALQFSLPIIFDDPLTYKYELEIAHDGPMNFVKSERLSSRSAGERFKRLFDRQGTLERSNVKTYGPFQLQADDPRLQTRSNVSLISSLVQFNVEPATYALQVFRSINHNIFINKFDYSADFANEFYQKFEDSLVDLKSKMKTIDVGIEDVSIELVNGKPSPVFKHSGLNIPQTYFYESSGTKKFYCMFPILHVTTQFGGMSVVDEIDSDLHPLLVPEIMEWFYRPEEERGGQLIMSCHHASLLDSLTKEEVWFAEKSLEGATDLYPLSNITGVRRTTNLYRKYIGGAFGAVPKVG